MEAVADRFLLFGSTWFGKLFLQNYIYVSLKESHSYLTLTIFNLHFVFRWLTK